MPTLGARALEALKTMDEVHFLLSGLAVFGLAHRRKDRRKDRQKDRRQD